MKRAKKTTSVYAIYDREGTCVFVGNSKECADYLNITVGSLYSNISRHHKCKSGGYSIHKVESDKVESDEYD